jgi:two-component system nitrate/nitrite response regulator NarL
MTDDDDSEREDIFSGGIAVNLEEASMTHDSTSWAIPSDRSSAEAIIRPAFVAPALSEGTHSQGRNRAPVVTFLIETNALLREGLGRILSETAYSPAAVASSLDEIGPIHGHEGRVAVVIMDAAYDHDEACRRSRRLKDEDPATRIVMLVEQYQFRHVLDAYDAGADAYLMKSVSCEVLLKTLDLVVLGESIFPARTLCSVRDKRPSFGVENVDVLSSREIAIVRCLVDGDPNKVIARKLNIAEATVKVHVKAILRKIQAKNRTQAAVWGTSRLLDTLPIEEMKAAG